jgi:error-prone DNA polymerase
VRQRPGSAKGFCFLTLEDETGTSNAVLTPRVFSRFRMACTGGARRGGGPLQHVDGVIHARARAARARGRRCRAATTTAEGPTSSHPEARSAF